LFSPRYVSGFMAGQGVAGLAVSLLRIFSKLVFPNTPAGIKDSGYLYFSLSVLVIIVAVLAYLFVLQRSPVTKHYLSRPTADMRSKFSQFVTVPLSQYDARRDPKAISALDAAGAPQRDQALPDVSLMTIFRQVWLLGGVVFLIFFVTLALFPGITSELTSTNASLNDGQWFGIIMITLFDLGDLIGRTIPNWPRFVIRNERLVAVFTVLRVVFLPLFIWCTRHENIFTQDTYAYIIMLGFAISNGYLGTVSMMMATDKVPAREKELTGTFMVFFFDNRLDRRCVARLHFE